MTTFRPARATDEELPRLVGGREAAPPEWEEWSEEPGHDLVADEGGRIVGGIHVSITGRTEAWMENLRVLADFQGRGIASQLVREAEHLAIHYGAAKVRTAVPAHDYAALAVAQRGGYYRVLQCAVVETAITADPRHVPYDAPVEIPSELSAAEVTAFAAATGTLAGWDQLLPLGWRFRRMVPELVRGLINDKRALVAVRPDAIRPGARGRWQADDFQGIALFAERKPAVVLSVLDGSSPAMQALYGTVTERSSRQDVTRAVFFVPSAAAVAPLRVTDWLPHPWCPDGLVVVEKSVAA
ncbi:MAG TPA: GNAT family N-acetyltransferase [bacterium]